MEEIDKLEKETKKNIAWINMDEKIISFHKCQCTMQYEADEENFWKYVQSRVCEGYKLQ